VPSQLLGQVTGAAEKFQQSAKCSSKQNLPISDALQAPHCIYPPTSLSIPPFSHYHQSTHHSVRRRSFHLALFNATPFLAIHRAASLLHYITHRPREKPPHALFAAVLERFPLQKMTANKTKIKPQKHVVFTPVR